MFRSVVALLLIVLVKSPVYSRDEVDDALAHSEALYYEARFQESIQLLSRIDTLLKSEEGRLNEKINTKLQLALAHIGLNDTSAAKSFLRELYVLDPDQRLDPQQFSPKVLALADEAKAEATDMRCQVIVEQAQRYADAQDAISLIKILKSTKASCPALEALSPNAAELEYKTGLDFYKKGDLTSALDKFRLALDLSPKHDLAAQYSELIDSRLQVSVDQVFVQWQKDFNAHDFEKASADYQRLLSFNDPHGKTLLNQTDAEYRKAVFGLLESWKQACAGADINAMQQLRSQAMAVLPNRTIGEDILQQMMVCSNTDCLQMDGQVALARVKTRVNPEIPTAMVGQSPLNLHVAVRVDVNGDVAVRDIQGGSTLVNEVVRRALVAWKFSPIMDPTGRRCVDIDLPLLIRPKTAPQ